MSLLRDVTAHLDSLDVRFALIGAAAMAFHGTSRATLDIDLLLIDVRVLEPAAWSEALPAGVDVIIRQGDVDDPLAGVVRLTADGEREVDLVVGKRGWQQGILERAVPGSYSSVDLPVVRNADLVLLKLYAGGPQDAWDIRQLLAGDRTSDLLQAVAEHLGELPTDARELWLRIVAEP